MLEELKDIIRMGEDQEATLKDKGQVKAELGI
jgi:hypothetical protein